MHLLSSAILSLLFYHLTDGKKLVNSLDDEEKFLSILETFGYSPSCITTSIDTCTGKSSSEQSSSSSKNYTNIFADIKKQIQEIKYIKFGPLNCADLLARGDKLSGVRTVYPFPCCPKRPVVVYCDQTTDGGGWTVIQKRQVLPVREDFYRSWIEYVLGFGNVTGEHWIGLDNLHALVSTTLMEMRVDLKDFEHEKRWAKYGKFHVGDSASKYVLSIGRYSGDAGDSLSDHNKFEFSTYDVDNDAYASSCAQKFRGAWWYNSCHRSNLNGFPYEGAHTSFADGINWHEFKGHHYSLRKTTMSVRPKFK